MNSAKFQNIRIKHRICYIFYTINEIERERKRSIPFKITSKTKILQIKLTEVVKDLSVDNYKTQIKEN